MSKLNVLRVMTVIFTGIHGFVFYVSDGCVILVIMFSIALVFWRELGLVLL